MNVLDVFVHSQVMSVSMCVCEVLFFLFLLECVELCSI